MLKRDIYIPKTGTDDAVVDVIGECYQSKHAVVCFDCVFALIAVTYNFHNVTHPNVLGIYMLRH